MKKLTRILAGMSVLAVLMVCMTAVSFAGTAEDKVTVNFQAGIPGSYDFINQNLEVKGDLVEKYYPDLAEYDVKDGVSYADALVAAHVEKYGEDAVKDHLDMSYNASWGVVSMMKQFDHDFVGFYYQNGMSIPVVATSQPIDDGDFLFAGSYTDNNYADMYCRFGKNVYTVPVGKQLSMDFKCGSSMGDDYENVVEPEDVAIYTVDPETCEMKKYVGAYYENGKITARFLEKGLYYLAATGTVSYENWNGPVTEGIAGPLVKVIVGGDPSKKATVSFTAGMPGSFDYINEKLAVTGTDFENAFPEIAYEDKVEGVSLADVLVAAQNKKYGKDKAAEYMNFGSSSWGLSVYRQFGHDFVGFYYANGKSTDGAGIQPIKKGDKVFAGAYTDWNYADVYSTFDKASYTTTPGKKVTMKLTCGNSVGSEYAQILEPTDVKVMSVNVKTGAMKKLAGATYKNGKVTVKFAKKGTYYVSATGSVTYDNGWSGEVTGGIAGALAKVVVKDAVPAKPVIKSAKRTSKKVAVVTWKKAKNAKKYEVAYKKAGTSKWVKKTTAKTKITLKKLDAKKKYQVKVLAINGSAKSKYSKVLTIKVKK